MSSLSLSQAEQKSSLVLQLWKFIGEDQPSNLKDVKINLNKIQAVRLGCGLQYGWTVHKLSHPARGGGYVRQTMAQDDGGAPGVWRGPKKNDIIYE